MRISAAGRLNMSVGFGLWQPAGRAWALGGQAVAPRRTPRGSRWCRGHPGTGPAGIRGSAIRRPLRQRDLVHRRSGRVREYHLDACVWRPSRRRAIDVPAHGPVQGSARARRGTEPGVAEPRVLAVPIGMDLGWGTRLPSRVLRRRVRGGAPFTGGSRLADRPGRRRRAARRPARRRAPSTGAAIRRGGRRRHTAAEHPPRQPRRPARPKIPRPLRRETEPLRPLSPRPARLRQRPFPAPTARPLPARPRSAPDRRRHRPRPSASRPSHRRSGQRTATHRGAQPVQLHVKPDWGPR
jgi:hypothetical protein